LKYLADRVIRKVLNQFKQGEYTGIGISCLITEDGAFLQFASETLDLINKFDEKRYLRVTKELSWILNTKRIPVGSGEYRPSIRLCSVHCNFPNDHSLESRIQCASVIVHEATHGYLASKGIKYTKERRSQIERICVSESNRFLAKVAKKYPDISGKFIREFSPEPWQETWNTSRWGKFKKEISRILKS